MGESKSESFLYREDRGSIMPFYCLAFSSLGLFRLRFGITGLFGAYEILCSRKLSMPLSDSLSSSSSDEGNTKLLL